jgi:hypothetical protein
MWLELTEKLVDRCIQLFREKSSNKKRLFDEYVKPIYDSFDKIHATYLDTFLRLRSAIGEKTISIYDLVDQIEAEYLFTEGQREKLRRITGINHVSGNIKPKYETELIGDFLYSIHCYLTVPYSDGTERPQRWLGGYIIYVELLSNFRSSREKWERTTSDNIVWEKCARRWGEQKEIELKPKIKKLRPSSSKDKKYLFDHNLIMRNAKKQSAMVPNLVEKYIQKINNNNDFSEDEIAIEHLDKSVEMMQMWYGKIGEIYWKLNCELNSEL